MAAKNPPISVELVEDYVPEPSEKAHPLGVVGKDPRVEHVRVGEDHLASLAKGAPSAGWSVAVISEGPQIQLCRVGELA